MGDAIIRRRRLVILLSLLLAAASLAAMSRVTVNYDLAGYLPRETPSARALGVLSERLPNLDVYLPGVSLREAVGVKGRLAALPQVEEILWLDDVMDLRGTPDSFIDGEFLSQFYAGGPLFQITVDPPRAAALLEEVRKLYPEALFSGDAANQAMLRTVTMKEVSSIMYYVLPLVLLILLLSTRHWLEPFLFLAAIGLAILANEGSNLIFGRVSFVTRACSAVLQLAVSMDYAVFLLHRFSEYRAEGLKIGEAMARAMGKAASSIAASAATTVFGFLALLTMDFSLGKDMGLVLAKGVLLSYASVMVFLPALTVAAARLLEKTAHRPLLPSFSKSGTRMVRLTALAALALALLLPAYLGQARNAYLYGTEGMHGQGSRAQRDMEEIGRLFPRDRAMMLLVPQGQKVRTARLGEEISRLPAVSGVFSYAAAVGLQVPPQMLPQEARDRFQGGDYEKIVLYAGVPEEGPEAFGLVDRVRELAGQEFGADWYLLGAGAVNRDLRDTMVADNPRVLLAGAAAIFLVLLITFRNPVLPVLLLLTIEGSVWLNMCVPYFMGENMNFIGYLIVSSVQLGATVDYGILLAQRYLESRKELPAVPAAARAFSLSAPAILPPATILAVAGYALKYAAANNAIISQMGEIVGRGALLSTAMVLLVLPHLLIWFDRVIQKTGFARRNRRQA